MNHLLKQLFGGMEGDARNPGSRIAAHLPTLNVLARAYSWGPIVECGVGRGWSTIALLSGALDGGGKVHSYDRDEAAQAAALSSMKVSKDDPLIKHWSFTVKDSHEAATDWPDKSVSLFFLDTNHEYEPTVQELLLWAPKIHPNGITCGHDYFLHERWGPRAAVDKALAYFLSFHLGLSYRLQVIPNDDGLFILWPAPPSCAP
jgi:predicted O-methyltransferase YrrM